MPRKNFRELRKTMTPARQRRNAQAAKAMLAEVVLSELREASGLKQVEMAKLLGISQAGLSKLERQNDMKVSTLTRLVKAIGGELQYVVKLPTGVVRIGQFNETVES